MRMGSMVLPPCPHSPAYCGTLMRPLDPSGRVPGQIPIAFLVYPHTGAGAAAGAIVAQEGGPGLPSIGSRESYVLLYAPLRNDHDLIIIDPRGTGASAAINCKQLQMAALPTLPALKACAASLHGAADLFGTGLAADDMIAVLDSLGVGIFDYYGDSYGTFFGQVLAGRYPDRLRSVVLDGAYGVQGESAFWPNAAGVLRHGFNDACNLAPACKSLGGSSLARIEAMLAALRKQPVNGNGPNADGTMLHEVANPTSIGVTMYNGLSGPIVYRELDAAARALAAGDTAPLMRLLAENDEHGAAGAASGYSRGLEAAVSCMDYPQIYDMASPDTLRLVQEKASLAAEQGDDPGVYGPLTIAEYLSMPLDQSLVPFCLNWPIKHPPYKQGHPVPQGAHFTSAPVLVINGGLDMLTPVADGRIATAEFPDARQVVIANSFHVDALYDVDDCAQVIVRRFTATLKTGDIACAARVKPVRLVPFFVQQAADATPAIPGAGNTATNAELSLVSAAAQTAADAMVRWYISGSGDVGLRGGNWSWAQAGDTAVFTLRQTRWAADLAVSGTLRWNLTTGAVTAALSFTADHGTTGNVAISYNDRESYIPATLTGGIGSDTIMASMPPP
jgi:pimeloyl-ACP methyl ester carboxylesterase